MAHATDGSGVEVEAKIHDCNGHSITDLLFQLHHRRAALQSCAPPLTITFGSEWNCSEMLWQSLKQFPGYVEGLHVQSSMISASYAAMPRRVRGYSDVRTSPSDTAGKRNTYATPRSMSSR